MLIYNSKRFVVTPFSSEKELEDVVSEHFEDIFGPASIYLPKRLIKTKDGFGTIPDGVVIDLAARKWYIIEAELSIHSIWSHIAPQVSKQILASSQRASKQLLIDLAVEQARTDQDVMAKFDDEGIAQIDVRSVLDKILDADPIVGIPIDSISADLRDWAQTLKYRVNLWIVRKLAELGTPSNIIYEVPEEFQPNLDVGSKEAADQPIDQEALQEIGIQSLIDAGLLRIGEQLQFSYKPRGGDRHNYIATIESDGSLKVLGQKFFSPSPAAYQCMDDAGTTRTTVNGWRSWQTMDGVQISELREQFLASQTRKKIQE